MRFPALLAVLAALLPGAALAQTVRGELVERGGGRPIPAALVVLLDAGGERRGAALTDAEGRFELRAPGAGTYRLRAERVGFASATSPPLALGVDQVLAYRMESDAATVTLSGITARSGRRCRARPGAGQATATLWEEARKALSAAAHAEAAGLLRYDLVTYRRDLHPGTLTVLRDERESLRAQGRTPFSSRPAEVLSREGFVRVERDSIVFDAPDAHVLLSDRFLADHCFRVREDGAEPWLVGLAFEPVEARRRFTEVAGVLWIDRGSAELRRLEYRYVNVGADLRSAGAGGRVEFERLPTGQWIVERWWIRMPQFERSAQYSQIPVGKASVLANVSTRLVSIREEGGEVISTSVRETRPARTGRMAGVVWDSVAGRPLPGARVFLSGTQWAAVADSAGRFAIDGVPEGRYTASFSHPELARWGAVPGSVAVEVKAGEEARATIGSPSLRTLVARICTPETMERFPGVLMGVVTRDGRPQPRARMELTWRFLHPMTLTLSYTGTQVETDGNGFYAACGVPTDVQVRIKVTSGAMVFRDQLVPQARVRRHDLRMVAGTRGDAVDEQT